MKNIFLSVISCFVFFASIVHAQAIGLDKKNIKPVNVFVSSEKKMGKEVLKVITDLSIKEFDEPTFIKTRINDSNTKFNLYPPR